MQLPNRENAYVPLQKLSDYLLSETHAVGKSKARYFRSLGFHEENISLLEQGLLAIARTDTVREAISTSYGTKYVMDGGLKTPDGVIVSIRTIWISEYQTDAPRFVTAYPIRATGVEGVLL
ncbi:MAG: hypothetical protein EXR62_18565 [Chloroflexi bacterium]|nr:hypothetical protein [Chloroflexota bacterium]